MPQRHPKITLASTRQATNISRALSAGRLAARILSAGTPTARTLAARILSAGAPTARAVAARIPSAGTPTARAVAARIPSAGIPTARTLAADMLAALLLSAVIAWPGQAHGDADGWEQTAGVQLMVGDSLDPGGTVYDAPDYQHTLVIPTTEKQAYLLALKTQTVSVIPLDAISWDDEHRPIPDLAAAEELGLLVHDDGVMMFDGMDNAFRVQPAPPLVGDMTYAELRAAKPDYVFAAKSYTPDAKAVAALSKVATDTQIELFFGSWCSHCQHWVPRLMRVLDDAKNPHITVNVHAMSEDQSQPEDSIRKYNASKTPTFVILQTGNELGRIEEEPLVSVEADLVRILKAK